MTREEKKLRRRQNRLLALCLLIIAVWVLCIALSVTVRAAFDGETYKTALAVIGALAVSTGLMRVIVWLDTPRGGKRR